MWSPVESLSQMPSIISEGYNGLAFICREQILTAQIPTEYLLHSDILARPFHRDHFVTASSRLIAGSEWVAEQIAQ